MGLKEINVNAALGRVGTVAVQAQTWNLSTGARHPGQRPRFQPGRARQRAADRPEFGVGTDGPPAWAAKPAKSSNAWTGGTWMGYGVAGAGWTGTSWASKTWAAATWSNSKPWSGAPRLDRPGLDRPRLDRPGLDGRRVDRPRLVQRRLVLVLLGLTDPDL